MEYYRRFGLAPKWSLDLQDLESRYYSLSRALHPDRYARDTAPQRLAALEASARLNDAYRILKDPIRRAEYLLEQLGVSGRESPELLEEVFELNLELEELLTEGDPEKLSTARARHQSLLDQADLELAARFEEYDRTEGRALLAEIRAILQRRRFLTNLICPPAHT